MTKGQQEQGDERHSVDKIGANTAEEDVSSITNKTQQDEHNKWARNE